MKCISILPPPLVVDVVVDDSSMNSDWQKNNKLNAES